ncbi:MAG: NAD(P)/FAD-dependent oxidoreductase, partial [Anaerovoracaceae bacterium]
AVCDGFFFKGLDVAVLGSGEYANHEAEALRPLAKSVTMISGKVSEVRGNSTLEEIVLESGKVLPAAGLFVAEGTAGSADLARKLGAEIKDNKIVVNQDMATNIPGLYAAGDCTGGLLQIAKAVHEGAVAGLSVMKLLRE